MLIFQIDPQSDTHVNDQALVVDLDQSTDTRQWRPEHYDAVNIPNPSILALTPPQGDDTLECKDIDVRGPGRTL